MCMHKYTHVHMHMYAVQRRGGDLADVAVPPEAAHRDRRRALQRRRERRAAVRAVRRARRALGSLRAPAGGVRPCRRRPCRRRRLARSGLGGDRRGRRRATGGELVLQRLLLAAERLHATVLALDRSLDRLQALSALHVDAAA